jgi:ribosomal protein S18 acetylase RimI-like enzyme
MTMRLLRLPGDLMLLGEMLTESFQYPENEAWNVQTDEMEQLIDTVRNLRRIWPLIRLIQLLSPSLRDLMRGHVWEEDGRLVGTAMFRRRGSTDVWVVGTVGVLPAYRRRGIARKLMEAGLDSVRQRGGKKALLDVIDGNIPAYALYESLGFEHYSGSVEFHTIPEEVPAEPTLPDGYTQLPLDRFAWQPRYELEQRILPEDLLKYEPVEVGSFRQPAMMRLLAPLVMSAQGVSEAGFAIRTTTEGQIVAQGRCSISTRGTGLSRLEVRLDPGHAELAPYIVGYLLHKVAVSSPGRRVELSVPQWMEAVIAAAEEAGFKRRLQYCRMGLRL